MAYVSCPMTAASTPSTYGRCKRKRKMDDAPLIAAPGADPRKLLELHVQDTNGMWLVMPRNLSVVQELF